LSADNLRSGLLKASVVGANGASVAALSVGLRVWKVFEHLTGSAKALLALVGGSAFWEDGLHSSNFVTRCVGTHAAFMASGLGLRVMQVFDYFPWRRVSVAAVFGRHGEKIPLLQMSGK
jgi:hypothetical protein